MIFGRQPQGHAATLYRSSDIPNSVRGLTRGSSWLFATLCVFVPMVVLTAGCGGSNSTSSGTGTSAQTRDAVVTGTVQDLYASRPIVGATVTFGNLSTFTGADGSFSLSTTAGTSGNVKVQGPSGVSYYNTGQVSGRLYDLKNNGIAVPTLASKQTYSVGTILLYSQSYPPPPPANF